MGSYEEVHSFGIDKILGEKVKWPKEKYLIPGNIKKEIYKKKIPGGTHQGISGGTPERVLVEFPGGIFRSVHERILGRNSKMKPGGNPNENL